MAIFKIPGLYEGESMLVKRTYASDRITVRFCPFTNLFPIYRLPQKYIPSDP